MEFKNNSFLWAVLVSGLPFYWLLTPAEEAPINWEEMRHKNILIFNFNDEIGKAPLLGCPEVKIEYKEGATYSPTDDTTLTRAKIRCGNLYPNSPCVKRFVKLGLPDNVRYRVTCGGSQ